ncbi:hypothetical protein BC829DRAFT_413934 [Chytridium lagenaria]|nr:hypothetical protein BC829DRAFT_413934 [Chytridium lagenaria]
MSADDRRELLCCEIWKDGIAPSNRTPPASTQSTFQHPDQISPQPHPPSSTAPNQKEIARFPYYPPNPLTDPATAAARKRLRPTGHTRPAALKDDSPLLQDKADFKEDADPASLWRGKEAAGLEEADQQRRHVANLSPDDPFYDPSKDRVLLRRVPVLRPLVELRGFEFHRHWPLEVLSQRLQKESLCVHDGFSVLRNRKPIRRRGCGAHAPGSLLPNSEALPHQTHPQVEDLALPKAAVQQQPLKNPNQHLQAPTYSVVSPRIPLHAVTNKTTTWSQKTPKFFPLTIFSIALQFLNDKASSTKLKSALRPHPPAVPPSTLSTKKKVNLQALRKLSQPTTAQRQCQFPEMRPNGFRRLSALYKKDPEVMQRLTRPRGGSKDISEERENDGTAGVNGEKKRKLSVKTKEQNKTSSGSGSSKNAPLNSNEAESVVNEAASDFLSKNPVEDCFFQKSSSSGSTEDKFVFRDDVDVELLLDQGDLIAAQGNPDVTDSALEKEINFLDDKPPLYNEILAEPVDSNVKFNEEHLTEATNESVSYAEEGFEGEAELSSVGEDFNCQGELNSTEDEFSRPSVEQVNDYQSFLAVEDATDFNAVAEPEMVHVESSPAEVQDDDDFWEALGDGAQEQEQGWIPWVRKIQRQWKSTSLLRPWRSLKILLSRVIGDVDGSAVERFSNEAEPEVPYEDNYVAADIAPGDISEAHAVASNPDLDQVEDNEYAEVLNQASDSSLDSTANRKTVNDVEAVDEIMENEAQEFPVIETQEPAIADEERPVDTVVESESTAQHADAGLQKENVEATYDDEIVVDETAENGVDADVEQASDAILDSEFMGATVTEVAYVDETYLLDGEIPEPAVKATIDFAQNEEHLSEKSHVIDEGFKSDEQEAEAVKEAAYIDDFAPAEIQEGDYALDSLNNDEVIPYEVLTDTNDNIASDFHKDAAFDDSADRKSASIADVSDNLQGDHGQTPTDSEALRDYAVGESTYHGVNASEIEDTVVASGSTGEKSAMVEERAYVDDFPVAVGVEAAALDEESYEEDFAASEIGELKATEDSTDQGVVDQYEATYVEDAQFSEAPNSDGTFALADDNSAEAGYSSTAEVQDIPTANREKSVA